MNNTYSLHFEGKQTLIMINFSIDYLVTNVMCTSEKQYRELCKYLCVRGTQPGVGTRMDLPEKVTFELKSKDDCVNQEVAGEGVV